MLFQRFYNWYARRLASSYAADIKSHLTNEEWTELVEMSRAAQRTDRLFRCLTEPGASFDGTNVDARRMKAAVDSMRQIADFDAAMTPEAVLSNPVITPYRRSAFRLLPNDIRSKIGHPPIIATPWFTFEAFASELKSSGRKFIELPFGVVFALGAVAEVSLGIYSNDAPDRVDALNAYCTAFHSMIREMDALTIQVYMTVKNALGSYSRPSLGHVHFTHLMGVFLLLHEIGHVVLEHWTPKDLSALALEERDRMRHQESEADQFAMRTILRIGESQQLVWDDVREMHVLCVCLLLSVLEQYYRVTGKVVPGYYPAFEERSNLLLETFRAPRRLLNSVRWAREIFAKAAS